MALGMTVWFDNQAKNIKNFGVYFPRGYRGSTLPFIRRGQIVNEDGVPATLDTLNSDLGIRTSEKADTLIVAMETAETQGLKGRIGFHDGNFVYELKVPFRSEGHERYAIDAAPGNTISIGFETTKITLDNMGRVLPEDKMRLSERNRTVLTPEPLDFWVLVHLPKKNIDPGKAVN
jgi:hypothetical protein